MQNKGIVIGLGVLVLASCGFLMFGVGQGAGEEPEVKAAVDTYVRAFVRGDGEKACEALTDAARDAVAGMAARVGARDCPTAMQRTREVGGRTVVATARSIRVGKVDVQGHGAKVTLRADGRDAIAELEKVGDDWKIASLPQT